MPASEKYTLEKIGRGRRVLWICSTDDHKARGAGSRPDLAIRDYKTQRRRWDKHDAAMQSTPKQLAVNVLHQLAVASQVVNGRARADHFQ